MKTLSLATRCKGENLALPPLSFHTLALTCGRITADTHNGGALPGKAFEGDAKPRQGFHEQPRRLVPLHLLSEGFLGGNPQTAARVRIRGGWGGEGNICFCRYCFEGCAATVVFLTPWPHMRAPMVARELVDGTCLAQSTLCSIFHYSPLLCGLLTCGHARTHVRVQHALIVKSPPFPSPFPVAVRVVTALCLSRLLAWGHAWRCPCGRASSTTW